MRRTVVLQEIQMMRFEEAEEEGFERLYDKRITQASHRRAPVDEVMKVMDDAQGDLIDKKKQAAASGPLLGPVLEIVASAMLRQRFPGQLDNKYMKY